MYCEICEYNVSADCYLYYKHTESQRHKKNTYNLALKNSLTKQITEYKAKLLEQNNEINILNRLNDEINKNNNKVSFIINIENNIIVSSSRVLIELPDEDINITKTLKRKFQIMKETTL